MSDRKNISSGAPWEDKAGYSRAVKAGNVIEVSGTVAIENGSPIGAGDPYVQSKKCLEIIATALKSAGSSITHVVRTRIYVTDITQWEAVANAHAEFFKDIKPATTMVEVSRLMDKEFLVEIEATAIIP